MRDEVGEEQDNDEGCGEGVEVAEAAHVLGEEYWTSTAVMTRIRYWISAGIFAFCLLLSDFAARLALRTPP